MARTLSPSARGDKQNIYNLSAEEEEVLSLTVLQVKLIETLQETRRHFAATHLVRVQELFPPVFCDVLLSF